MSWSFGFGRILGIPLRVHVTFLLLLVWVAIAWAPGGTGAAMFGVGFILLLFVCVILHELGHATVAQRFGVKVKEIILLPIGGLAVLGRNPHTPREELLIAIAGPLVNFVIALALELGFIITGHRQSPDLMGLVHLQHPSIAAMMHLLLRANLALAIFNLIPAFPMDGGRILRGILGFFMPNARATRISTQVSQYIAILLFFFAVMQPNLLLAIVAALVFFAAGAERMESQAGTILSTRRVGDAYNRYALTLSLNDRVSNVVDYLLKSYQPDFAVVNRGQLQGIVTRMDVAKWLASNTYDVFVTEIMEETSQFLRVQADQSLDDVRHQLMENDQRVAAVFEHEIYLGLVSLEDISEALAILAFLDRSGAGGQFSTARRVSEPVSQSPQPM